MMITGKTEAAMSYGFQYRTIAINGYGEIFSNLIQVGEEEKIIKIPFGVDKRGYFFYDEWHRAKWYYSPKRILIAEAPCCVRFRAKRCFGPATVRVDTSKFVPCIVYLGQLGVGRVLR